MTKLDRTKPFGTVVGSDTGALYYQFGRKFNGNGDEIGSEAAQQAPEPAPEPVAEEPATVTREQLEDLHVSVIKKLVAKEGLELETGVGSKARNIDNLLAAG